jgi:hypothetical protein
MTVPGARSTSHVWETSFVFCSRFSYVAVLPVATMVMKYGGTPLPQLSWSGWQNTAAELHTHISRSRGGVRGAKVRTRRGW